jgi:hypothetical protein
MIESPGAPWWIGTRPAQQETCSCALFLICSQNQRTCVRATEFSPVLLIGLLDGAGVPTAMAISGQVDDCYYEQRNTARQIGEKCL